jgi:bifunctional DNA-binding transcriptional regulator/antitoxin component of YhaV-PrlF toxin-antitoxin module
MAMHMTSGGQVTIPIAIRERAGLVPNTEVDFDFDGRDVRIRPARRKKEHSRGEQLVGHLRRHRGDVPMTTDQIMTLTRGE